MKTTSQKLGLAAILAVLANTAVSAACSTRSGVTTTFYGYPDNDPPGSATAYNCGRNYIAGGITSGTALHVARDFDGALGVGTYKDPLTFASAAGEFSRCEVIYSPYLKKYLRYEDYCEQCSTCSPEFFSNASFPSIKISSTTTNELPPATDWKSGKYHIDIWTGSSTVNGGNNQIQCEDKLTPNPQSIVRQPPSNLPVDCKLSLYSSSTHSLHSKLFFENFYSISTFGILGN